MGGEGGVAGEGKLVGLPKLYYLFQECIRMGDLSKSV